MYIQADTLQRFLVNDLAIRGEIVRLQTSYQTIISQQAYPPAIASLLGQTLAASALLAATIKFKGQLIIQLQTNGPIELLATHCNEQLQIRGIAKWRDNHSEFNPIFNEGILAITISADKGERYQGIVKLSQDSLTQAIENYFNQSEQLATLLLLTADQQQVTGMLLQQLPHQDKQHHLAQWEMLRNKLHSIRPEQWLSEDNESLISQILEEEITLYSPEPIIFKCSCSKERSANAIGTLNSAEIKELLEKQQHISVACEFCHHNYIFTAEDIYPLLHS